LLLAGCTRESGSDDVAAPVQASRLVLYSSLEHERVLAVADAYHAFSGTQVDFLVEPADVLVAQLADEASRPPADVVLIRNAVSVGDALEEDVLRPVEVSASASLNALTPRDPDGYWQGVGVSAEVIVADGEAGVPGSVSGYRSLAQPEFADRLCLRRGSDARSVALVAMLVAALGEADAELVVRGWRNNLARAPFETDAGLLAAVDEGSCAVAVADSKALAAYLTQHPDSNLQVHFPAAEEGGALVHPTAAAVNRHAGDAAGAARFLAWLTSADGQSALHATGYEFPAGGGVMPEAPLSAWLPFDAAAISPARAAFHHEQARQLMARARYR